MTKTTLQFRHNGREVAVFVVGGVNLLVALREGVGDMTPKFGCGQGGCGACSVLIDGELHLSCLTLAETVEPVDHHDDDVPPSVTVAMCSDLSPTSSGLVVTIKGSFIALCIDAQRSTM